MYILLLSLVTNILTETVYYESYADKRFTDEDVKVLIKLNTYL